MTSPNYTYGPYPASEISEQVRKWRKYRNLRQGELEERAGLSHNTVSRIETGSVSPRLETVERLARAMDLSVEELQFKTPPDRAADSVSEGVQLLLARLEALPPDKRKGLLDVFHRMINLTDPDL